ncbi:hypothetical protein SAMN05421757_10790 [Tropicimonas sediminicola]|uniref:Uncharacterized protein n=1 Tax=Tropicimonas sediminicola TaxID=1031541 RepID=A0A239KFF2_9RHOB|nr:hypothetical protein SAMN05421757_10790 [Tropicimonas sediminicola]
MPSVTLLEGKAAQAIGDSVPCFPGQETGRV